MNKDYIAVGTFVVTCAVFVYMYKRFIDEIDVPDPDEMRDMLEQAVQAEVQRVIAEGAAPANGNGGADAA